MKKEIAFAEAQRQSLKALGKIKEICERENIRFWLAWGTLIGAVRHQGLIPWDDDIDIMMPRADYERFTAYCIAHEAELGPYRLMNYRTNDRYIYGLARFCDTRYWLDYDNARDYGLGLFVDIYPMDGVNLSDQAQMRTAFRWMKQIDRASHPRMVKGKNPLFTALKVPLHWASRFYDVNKRLARLDALARKYDYETSENVSCVVWSNEVFDIFPRSYFEKTLWMPFEGEQMPVPGGYHEILRATYGDYMQLPPPESRVAHHCYKVYLKDER